ncbi:MAG: hypothetical protein IKQ77_13470 [Prevotella sp.]|nr:hypothetical protein [Prevotella sp.]
MARKRKTRKDDPNQLMLFSLEEMSGEADLSDDKHTKDVEVSNESDEVRAGTRPAPTTSGGLETEDASGGLEKEAASEDVEEPATEDVEEPATEDVDSPTEDVEEPVTASEEIKPSATGVELMSNVIRLLDGLSPSVVRLVAMQSAALVQGGVDSLEHYRLPSLSGMVFRGDALERIAYVSFVRSFPNMVDKLGLDFSAEYEEAE